MLRLTPQMARTHLGRSLWRSGFDDLAGDLRTRVFTIGEYYVVTMTRMDWEKERERLTSLYAGMEDGELRKIAFEPGSLTDVARQVLRAEMLKRGLPALFEEGITPTATSRNVELPPPVMVGRYRDLPEATIAKSILDSAGIESFFVDDNMVRLDWFLSNVLGRIKLLVRPEDAEAAAKMIGQSTPEKFDVEGIGEYRQPRCPRCQSLDVAFREFYRRLAYGSLLLGVPIHITHPAWECLSCGHGWEEDDADTPGSNSTTDRLQGSK